MGVVPLEQLGRASRVAPQRENVSLAASRFHKALVTTGETLRLALDALRSHKLRSFLTLLGVILAVTTLVAVMSVVAGLNFYVSDRIANLGANVYLVERFGIITSYAEWIKAQKRPLITMDEYERLRDGMRTVSSIAAIYNQSFDLRSGDILDENVEIIGVTPNYTEIRVLNLTAGRFLNNTDESHRSGVALIGADVANKFFTNVDPIGKMLRAGTHTYQVVGVVAPIGSAFGQSQDNFILIPLETYSKEWRRQNDSLTLFVQARNTEMMQASEDEARMLLRAWRHLPWEDKDNFGILGSDSIMALWHDLTGNLAAVAVGLVSVFLVVGGIVIMNIMLASVTERTREIGIRRSLGARRKHIVLQFMAESAVLATVGGVLGLVLAYVLVAVGRSLTSIPMKTPISSVIIALSLSTAVGLFFGIYPATRAAKLDPIEALRAET